MKVQLFIPCFIDQLYPGVGISMVKLLRKAGCELTYNSRQTCCGQPAFNAGFRQDAKAVCSKFIREFEPGIPIVAPSASCVGFVRNYLPSLLEESSDKERSQQVAANVFELSDFLVNHVKQVEFGASLQGAAVYHDSCAALRECSIKQEPRQLLKSVAGLELREMNDVETCCGFGGSFAVKFEDISAAMGEQKTDNAAATNADYIISTDMSCLMHLDGMLQKRRSKMKCLHLAEVLTMGW